MSAGRPKILPANCTGRTGCVGKVNGPKLSNVWHQPIGVRETIFMKRSCLGWAFAGLISVVALGCSRASPVWNGTWKVNESKSTIPGPSFSIAISPAGEYHVDNGTYSESFRCDGKEYATTPKRTISCLQTGGLAIDTISREKGAKVATAHWELSDDGKMLTLKGTSTQPYGSVKPREMDYSRTSGSVGFAGGWTNTKRLESRPQLVLALNGRSLRISFAESGQYIDSPLDGSDAPVHGPGVPEGLTMAVTPHGSREFLTLKKMEGQIINQGSLRLSADGRILMEEYWNPKTPEQKARLVYEKQ